MQKVFVGPNFHALILKMKCYKMQGVTVWQANVGNVEVNELSAVVFALSEGDREADLPYRGGRTINDS